MPKGSIQIIKDCSSLAKSVKCYTVYQWKNKLVWLFGDNAIILNVYTLLVEALGGGAAIVWSIYTLLGANHVEVGP